MLWGRRQLLCYRSVRLSLRLGCSGFLTVLYLLLAGGTGAGAEERQPTMERRVIADGDGGSVWYAAEARMERDTDHARDGRAMHFHIDVDHQTGEPKYPIGWPRTYTNIPKENRDWTRWDFVEFWVYADSSELYYMLNRMRNPA